MSSKLAWRSPRSFTSLFEVDPARVEALRNELNEVGDDVARHPSLALDRVGSLQSFRVHVVEDPDGEFAPRLLVNSVYDGELETHLGELEQHAGAWLRELLRRHARIDGEASDLAALLLSRRVVEDAVYLGVVGGTRRDGAAEARLRDVLSELADRRRAAGEWGPGSSAERIRAAMREAVLALDDPLLPRAPSAPQGAWAWLIQRLDAARVFVSPISGILRTHVREALLPPGERVATWRRVTIPVVLALHRAWTAIPSWIFLRFVRRLEAAEPAEDAGIDLERVQALQRREDQRAQNPLSACTTRKPSAARGWLLRRVLSGAEGASRHVWNRGRLAGIDSIHVARFLRIDGGRRMLFLSDYDGSWERYLSDFLGQGRPAVIPIFSNMRGCPRASALFETTPRFAPRFLAFTRRYQNPVELWYSAWPELSVRNRLSNRRLRDGLFAESMSEDEAARWLEELG